MRVYALAVRDARSNAIGRVELECTPPGLAIGLYQLAAYTEGYAPGAAASGTRLIIPYGSITEVRVEEEQIHLAFDVKTIPYDRMTFSRFAAGPGVPPHELRKRRLILHLGSLAIATIVALIVVVLSARSPDDGAFFLSPVVSALGYGSFAAGLILAAAYSVGQRYFLRDPNEDEIRRVFAAELSTYVPGLERAAARRPRTPLEWVERLSELLPTSVAGAAATLAAAVLTALFTGARLLRSESGMHEARVASTRADPLDQAPPEIPSTQAGVPPPPPTQAQPERAEPPAQEARAGQPNELTPERNCLCDRADSPLWAEPLPRLTALLLDSRVIPRETHNRLEVDVAVVNNGDEPISELTLHVVFSEKKSGAGASKERTLYFEGPLAPGQAIKWTTEARGDSFRILAPDFGKLGQNGEGAAPLASFRALLDARNRPVRLHAVRVMSYLGDKAAHDEALKLKDAYRAREAPFLRRVLAATGELRVCDVEVQAGTSVGACVHNTSTETKTDLGLIVEELDQKFDPAQPLANPPLLEGELKFRIFGEIPPDSGKYVRAALPASFRTKPGHALEVMADRYDLLE